MMRVLFSSYPLHGHLLPMLPLARAAQRRGHEVVVATGGSLATKVARYGFDVWQVEAMDHAPTGTNGTWIPGAPADASGRARAPELVARAEAWGPDVVVHEPLDYAAPIAAARTRARHFVHGLGPPIPAAVHEFLRPGLDALFGEWGLPGLSHRLFSTPYLDICPPSLQPRGPCLWTHRRPLRPTAIEDGEVGDAPIAFAELPHRRTINVTLGTVVNKDLGLFRTILAGLRGIDANVVVTVGPDLDPALLGPPPPSVVVARFIPHGRLLPHCHMVVNHGGNGSVLAALAHGLPLLLLPRGADQLSTSVACARAGVALVIRSDQVSGDGIARAARWLLHQPAPAAAARRLQQEIGAMPSPEEVVDCMCDDEPSRVGTV